ncbi:MAG: helix-turn-helix domain-containing protein, partial [Pseudomonadota bacterium]
GNVRELENVIQSIVSMNSEGEIITSLMLPKELTSTSAFAANENDESAETPSKNVFEDKDIISIPDLERMAIEHALELCKGNVQKAALQLKISPATLYRKKPNIEKVQQALSAD